MKGRFAPTPSGQMHLGNALSALLCWLSVRSQGGRLLLRVEDLDLQRTSPAFTQDILQDLAWLGLSWDEGPSAGPGGKAAGENGPYLQSLRSDFYAGCLRRLDARHLLYPCFCSRAQLHAATAPHQSDGSYVYGGRCRSLTKAQRQAQNRPGAVRVLVPDETISFTDGCQGPYSQNLAENCGDFILRRSDGVYAYQLAAPADDGAMGVTEVVRGRDLLSSTPRQIWLMRQLGYTPPRFCHTPLLLAADGRRLSKRDGDLSLAALRQRGVKPEDLVGHLAHLCGLLPTPRPVSAAQLAPSFCWENVRREDILLPPRFAQQL